MGRRTIPKGFTRELAPEGVHLAVLVQFIDLGTQPNSNPEWSDARKCQLAFECTDLRSKEGKAIVEYKQYTFSDSPKGTLMKDLKSWLNVKDGNYDMSDALGKPAMITITHKTTDKGTFSNISNISGLPRGVKIKKATEPLRAFFLDDDFDEAAFKQLPQHIQTKIADSPEYQELLAEKMSAKSQRRNSAPSSQRNVAQTIEEKPKRGRSANWATQREQENEQVKRGRKPKEQVINTNYRR